MSKQSGGIMQQLLLLCCPCQAGAQLMHHLCRRPQFAARILPGHAGSACR